MSHEELTAPTIHQTKFPFPFISSTGGVNDAENTGPKERAHPSDTVEVEICSELTTLAAPFDLFGNAGPSVKETRRKLSLIHDTNGQPIIFTVTNTMELYAVAFVANGVAGWQAFNITPPSGDLEFEVDAFDTLELGDKIHVIVSLELYIGIDEATQTMRQSIWYTSFKKPNLVANPATGVIEGSPFETLEWKEITSSLGDRDVTSLLLCPSVFNPEGFHITAGTREHGKYVSTPYMIDPTQSDAPWKQLVMSGSPSNLLGMQPVFLGSFRDTEASKKKREVGIALVFEQTGENAQIMCGIEIFDEDGGEKVRSYTLQTGKLGLVKSVYASLNPWGLTDLLVAGEKGIGFYESSVIEALKGNVILPKISFKQVVCSEIYGAIACKLAIFAISEQDELYYIEGSRSIQGNRLTFNASGIPIRTQVTIMSPQYNAISNTSEIMFVQETANGLRHLVRDPVTSLWSESAVEIKMPKGTPASLEKESVYLSTITFTNGDNIPVPKGYPVRLTCEPPTHVTCNDRSFMLSSKPTEVYTNNDSGHIDLMLPVDPLMGSCTFKLELTKYKPEGSESQFFEINPAQRVVNIMSSIKGQGDLENARGPKGEVIFKDQSKLGDASGFMSQFGTMAEQINDPTKSEDGSEKTLVAWEKEADSKEAKPTKDQSWLEDLSDTAGKFLGDAIECLRLVVKSAVKFAVKMVGKVLKFALSIAGKAFCFIIKGVGTLLSSACGFLKDYLGIDLSFLTKWLGVAFSTESAKKTQAVLLRMTHGAANAAEKFLIHNKYRVEDWMDDAQAACESFLPDVRKPPSKKEKPSLLSRILNNPVVKALLKFNPISWVLEGIAEGFSESLGDIELPSLSAVTDAFMNIGLNVASKGNEILQRLFDSVGSELGDLLMNPSKAFDIIKRILSILLHSGLDAMKTVILSFFDAIIASFRGIMDFMTGVWKIPGLTDGWEEFAEQEFTLLNFGTYIFSLILNIGNLFFGEGDGLIFDNISEMNWSSYKPDFIPTKKMESLAKQPPGPYDIVVRTASVPANSEESHVPMALRRTSEYLGIAAGVCRGILGAFESYSLLGEVIEGKTEPKAKSTPPTQHKASEIEMTTPQTIVEKGKSTGVEVLQSAEAKSLLNLKPSQSGLDLLNAEKPKSLNTILGPSLNTGPTFPYTRNIQVKVIDLREYDKPGPISTPDDILATRSSDKYKARQSVLNTNKAQVKGIRAKVMDKFINVPSTTTLALAGVSTFIQVATWGLKYSIKALGDTTTTSDTELCCIGVNAAANGIGLGLALYAHHNKSGQHMKIAGVVIQAGGIIELVGDGIANGGYGWLSRIDLGATISGSVAALLMLLTPKSTGYAAVFTILDNTASLINGVAQLIHTESKIDEDNTKYLDSLKTPTDPKATDPKATAPKATDPPPTDLQSTTPP